MLKTGQKTNVKKKSVAKNCTSQADTISKILAAKAEEFVEKEAKEKEAMIHKNKESNFVQPCLKTKMKKTFKQVKNLGTISRTFRVGGHHNSKHVKIDIPEKLVEADEKDIVFEKI